MSNQFRVGLPEKSLNATGLITIMTVCQICTQFPKGLFKQSEQHEFNSTRILAFNNEQYSAAVSNWFDFDNDGRLDLLIALKNESFIQELVGI